MFSVLECFYYTLLGLLFTAITPCGMFVTAHSQWTNWILSYDISTAPIIECKHFELYACIFSNVNIWLFLQLLTKCVHYQGITIKLNWLYFSVVQIIMLCYLLTMLFYHLCLFAHFSLLVAITDSVSIYIIYLQITLIYIDKSNINSTELLLMFINKKYFTLWTR